jgi:mannose-6-phosphate isomerase-like protein (cupin superfamily)
VGGNVVDLFGVDQLRERMSAEVVEYLEFLRVPAMSAGIYRLPAGSPDLQGPHREDEVYVVMEGRATLMIDGDERPVSRGSVAFVAAGAEHRFQDITEDLVAVVLFAPAESEPGT